MPNNNTKKNKVSQWKSCNILCEREKNLFHVLHAPTRRANNFLLAFTILFVFSFIIYSLNCSSSSRRSIFKFNYFLAAFSIFFIIIFCTSSMTVHWAVYFESLSFVILKLSLSFGGSKVGAFEIWIF
jgi:hypothetical protein